MLNESDLDPFTLLLISDNVNMMQQTSVEVCILESCDDARTTVAPAQKPRDISVQARKAYMITTICIP
ncbi:hypothetical protein ZOSMA_164G00250 [Zostera marina]|uniref:Uncharacterized protein n=1 Tax=Zostera marina TaxID=29655 RepID=A0A0K9PTR1_ZOSMR|nr:hypothetical protein ZOSMA_164G00250 [Zostera marina]